MIDENTFEKTTTFKKAGYFSQFIKDKSAIIGIIIVGWFFVWSLIQGLLEDIASYTSDSKLGYLLLPSNPFKINYAASLEGPSTHSLALIFGTNFDGESILSRMLYSMPRDALVAVIVVFSAIIIGSLLGIISSINFILLMFSFSQEQSASIGDINGLQYY